jgi:hypothetical protein
LVVGFEESAQDEVALSTSQLKPELGAEIIGFLANVVFTHEVDRRYRD